MRTMAKLWSSKAKQLLSWINDEDIIQMATTACKGHLEFTTKNEAIDAIIAACDCPEDLLRKKKLKREYLLRYIWEYTRSSDASASLPIKADKRQLIRQILLLWGCGNANDPSFDCASSSTAREEEPDEESDDTRSSDQPGNPQEFESFLSRFSTQFLHWFYSMLNNCVEQEGHFGSQHFYSNCLLRLRCGSTDENSVLVEVQGGEEVAMRFKQFVTTERLLFHPNLHSPHGFQAIQESHGAILVKSNGTVHRRPVDADPVQPVILGPYEQMFLVIEDPHANTWKVQQTSLNINAEIIRAPNAVEYE